MTILTKFGKRIQKFDAFPKIETPYQNSSSSGGILTVLVYALLTYLVLHETFFFLKVDQSYEFLVDTERSQKLDINVDITIAMSCEYLRADVLDVSGTSISLSETFKYIPTKFSQGHRIRPRGGDKGEHFVVDQVHDAYINMLNTAKTDVGGDACRILGSISVNKLSGLLHFTAPGHGYAGVHVPHDKMNFTHIIDFMSFGTKYPGLTNPLDGTMELAESTTEMFQYFVSVVPTIYYDPQRIFGTNTILTSQYAVTDYYRTLDDRPGHQGLPGVFLKYDIEPISVRVTAARQGFFHFITRLCGIIGGIFVTVGMGHRLIRKILGTFGISS